MHPVDARRAALRAVLTVSLILGLVLGAGALILGGRISGSPAYADECGFLEVCPSATATVTRTGGPGGEGESHCYRDDGTEIDCHTTAGRWYAPYQCYIKQVPQDQWPPPDDPIYGGADPATGSVYWCTDDWTGANRKVFFPGEPPVDPTVLVYEAIARMRLEPIKMGTAPESGPDRMGLVGMPVWLWVDEPDPHTFGPISDGASTGPVSVTATANVTSIGWDMGDGHEPITCDGPGTPYEDRFGKSDSPDCRYRYQQTSADQPDGAYTVTATSHWEVTWTANTGASGIIRLTRTATTQLRIGEAQVLTQ